MTQIDTFPFDKENFNEIKEYLFGLNWPVVYLQEDGNEMYIGQTTTLYGRSKQHYENPERAKLKRIHILTDEEFNMSAAYDFESLLIQYISADGVFKLQNGNGGLINHKYFEKEKYQAKLESIWTALQAKKLVKQNLADIRNSEFFKYSPYKALTEDQIAVAEVIEQSIKKGIATTHIVHGGPGTGKSILALYLLKHLREGTKNPDLKVALVVSMTGLRSTLQRVVRKVPGMSADMVIGPSDVIRQKYDVLIVDESHRLRRRVNLTNFASYDSVNRVLKLPKNATQLDWIITSSKQQILFYDEKQNVVPGDVRATDFKSLKSREYHLTSQMRIEAGEDYLQMIDNLLEYPSTYVVMPKKYDFKIYTNISEMIQSIKGKDAEHKLSRMVAGYAWPWNTHTGRADYDIEIEGVKLTWNSTNIDWVNSPSALNEVGCIHTIQGYDLNYAGVIIGPELSFDVKEQKIVVDPQKYLDFNGRRSVESAEELERYIINIYKTLLTRGIKGTYVYIVDENLRHHIQSRFITHMQTFEPRFEKLVKSPITIAMVMVRLVGSAPCGAPMFGEENIEEYIEVAKLKIRPGYEYFALRAEGDSMNLAGIQDGDIVLCRQQLKADTGDKVVALLGSENVTIKEYGPRKNGIRLLLPRSTNKSHKPIVPDEGDGVQGVVQEVLE